MQDKNYKAIGKHHNYFISRFGYCFKIKQGKEEIIPIIKSKGAPRVKIANQNLNIVLLMMEYFCDIKSFDFKYKYKIANGRIPLENIKIIELQENATEDDKMILKYKCKEKSSSANSRVKYEECISPIDVLNSLKRNDFKCFYCGDSIHSRTWHLDHYNPISLGGGNVSENLVSSCKICNTMKGALRPKQFKKKCIQIVKRYKTIDEDYGFIDKHKNLFESVA